MNKIDELIQQYCPDGVEYVPIWSLTAWDKNFNGVEKSKQTKVIKYNYLLAADLKSYQVENGTVKLLTTNISNLYTTEELSDGLASDGEVVAIPWGGNPIVQYYKGRFLTADNRIATSLDTNILNNKFLYYCMLSQMKLIASFYRGSGIKHPEMSKVLDLEIPLPPLPVQEAIVNILDRFAEYTAELQAELQARQQQYNYYRDTLLSFEGREDVQEYILGDLFEFKNGLNASKEQFGHGTPIVNYVNVYKKNSIKASDLSGKVELDKSSIDRYRVKRGDVFFTRTSETREEIGIASVLLEDIEDCVFSGFVLRARPITDVLLPEFCKYCFSTYNIRKQIIQSSTLTTRALTNGTSLSKVKVLIPSKPEQQRIVDILDRFDHLTNDLSQGLPAEIEARQQQYKYYRDQLLTFKRM